MFEGVWENTLQLQSPCFLKMFMCHCNNFAKARASKLTNNDTHTKGQQTNEIARHQTHKQAHNRIQISKQTTHKHKQTHEHTNRHTNRKAKIQTHKTHRRTVTGNHMIMSLSHWDSEPLRPNTSHNTTITNVRTELLLRESPT